MTNEPLRRYLLFAGSAYYPSGGWEDFVGTFDTVDEAKAADAPGECGWAHIVDAETAAIIESRFDLRPWEE